MFSFFKKKEQLEEFSVNFDSENVVPFLKRIIQYFESGFGEDEIRHVEAMMKAMATEDEKSLEFKVRANGVESKLVVAIFMDDNDAPDLYLYTNPATCAKIQSEYERYGEEIGI
jgi:hypothetical protein